jgi:uncharacterized protein
VTFLLDVNVLIALVDSPHVNHDAAHNWFAARLRGATCPIMENSLVRIIANPKYPNALSTTADAMAPLAQLARLPGASSVRTTSACATQAASPRPR